MKCATCGSELRPTLTDLPFKVTDRTMVVVKEVPVLQCGSCPEYMIEDHVMAAVDRILSHVNTDAELEVVRFAA
jgi:YgiT-type zinc finger domain-containing protein